MTTLLDAARQALPGAEWESALGSAWAYIYGARVTILGHPGGEKIYAHDGVGKCGWFDSIDEAAQWLRAQVTARRDALDAALGDKHLGTSARDWLGLLADATPGDDPATWADLLADLHGLDGHDDAQTLFLRAVDRQQRLDAAEAKLKAVVAAWPMHYHRQGCALPCNCGADAANAARAEARRVCGVGNG